jgi:hypothetical protein
MKIMQVVPVIEMSSVLGHLQHSAHGLLETIGHTLKGDESEVESAYRGEKLKADIRWRGSHRHDRLRIGLKIVRCQPMRLGSYEFAEERPMDTGISESLGAVGT